MYVCRATGDLRLNADKATRDMASIEDPIRRIPGEDVCNLLLSGKKNQRRLQQTGADHRWDGRLGHGDGARTVRFKMLRFGITRARGRGSGGGEGKPTGDEEEDGWFHCL